MPDLQPVSLSVSRISSETFSRKFVSLGRILSQWEMIIGPGLAEKAQPLRLLYRKPLNSKEKPTATLEIAVSSADAALLYYQTNLILERINQIFGEKWVTSLRFSHVPAREGTEDKYIKQSPPLPDQDREQLSSSLSFVRDEGIRKQLENLGQAVLRKGRS